MYIYMTNEQQLVIFESGTGQVEVRLEGDTVWLSQTQMAELFGTSSDNISLHLKNIYKDDELQESATTEDFSVVRQEGARQVQRKIQHYNLDAIISVGYRVSSARATRFRQWATRILREHLTQGYTLNRQRFEQNAAELEAALALVKKAAAGEALTTDQGRERGGAFAATLGNLEQTVFGEPAYPTVETKAAHLLYFVIKNHPFSDGNKRIGSYLFVDFLARNGQLLRGTEPVINDVGLAALALLVAESDPSAKEVMIRLIENMLAPSQSRVQNIGER